MSTPVPMIAIVNRSRGSGQMADAEKSNLLTLLGWRILRMTSPHVRSGQALRWIEDALNVRAAGPETGATR